MNIVVLGCGAILEQGHRKPLHKASKTLGCRVAGVVDTNPKRLANVKGWFPGAEGFPSAEACFDKLKDIGLTIVLSPPLSHARHIEASFVAGSHVLCEKPLAGSDADCQHIIGLMEKYRRVLAVGMTRRYYSCFVEARRRIREGALGRNIQFIHREGGIYKWPVASAAPFRRETGGGGVLLDKGVHALDTLEFLFGNGKVESCFDDGFGTNVEANSVVNLSLERAKGQMQLSWDMNLANGLQIAGSEGQYWIPLGPLNTIFSRATSSQPWRQISTKADWPLDLAPKPAKTGFPIGYDDCFLFQLIQTLRAIKLGESPAATAQQAASTLGLIRDAYGMAKPLAKPWLSPAEQQLEFSRHWRKNALPA